jgi:Mg2+ and Co2+ transporter CorA
MIRSIVAPIEDSGNETFSPRRNLTCEHLEQVLANGDTMWIDIVDAEGDEITWLEHLLKLHPAVIEDLKRMDRQRCSLSRLSLSVSVPAAHQP